MTHLRSDLITRDLLDKFHSTSVSSSSARTPLSCASHVSGFLASLHVTVGLRQARAAHKLGTSWAQALGVPQVLWRICQGQTLLPLPPREAVQASAWPCAVL